jgi:hypothetical protein
MNNNQVTVEFNEESFVRSMEYQPVDVVIVTVSMNINNINNLKFYILVRETQVDQSDCRILSDPMLDSIGIRRSDRILSDF